MDVIQTLIPSPQGARWPGLTLPVVGGLAEILAVQRRANTDLRAGQDVITQANADLLASSGYMSRTGATCFLSEEFTNWRVGLSLKSAALDDWSIGCSMKLMNREE